MARRGQTIPLLPVRGDTLYPTKLTKESLTELFSFNAHDEGDVVVTQNHSDLDQEVSTVAMTRSRETTFALPIINNASILPPKNVADFDDEESNKALEKASRRFFVYPGQRPFAKSLPKNQKFNVPKYPGSERPIYAYEDTGRVAICTGRHDQIRNASFVTNAATLSYLYYIVLDRDNNMAHANKDRSISITVHDVNGTTFLKAINSHLIVGNHGRAAKQHLKAESLEHFWEVEDVESHANVDLNVYKRVIGYRLGDYDLVVEDPDQVTLVDTDAEDSHTERLKRVTVECFDQGRPSEDNAAARKEDSPYGKGGLRLFTHRSSTPYELINANLWFSGSRFAKVSVHTKGQKGTAPFTDPFVWHSPKLDPRPNANRNRSWESFNDDVLTAKIDQWTDEFENGRGIKLLYGLLGRIKKLILELKEQQEEGEMTSVVFILKHLNKVDIHLAVGEVYGAGPPVKLVSDELVKALWKED
ncbi:hypothetical protein F5Y06DRAFT_298145 [Hypoxylon sp. FL0890]|nr:hypothetical protein F5Y06DRAFT_298145 [Hypoxylon sp. FL0890]